MAGLRSNNRFVILTSAPASPIAHIHSRMPVILNQDGEQAWLNPVLSFGDLSALLQPYAGDLETVETPRAPPRQSDLFG